MLQTLDISNYEFGLQHRVLKILRFKYLILFQRLNSFNVCLILIKLGLLEQKRIILKKLNCFEKRTSKIELIRLILLG